MDKWFETYTDDAGRHFLFWKGHDDGENVLHQMISVNGAHADVAARGMSDAKFDKIFDDFDAQKASEAVWSIVAEMMPQ